MATWTSLGSATLYNSGTNVGSVQFQYDKASTSGTTWPCRLRVIERSGYSFTVAFNNITIAGTNYGNKAGVNESTGNVWTGNIAGGTNSTAKWTCPWYSGSASYTINFKLPAKTSAPTGLYINNISSTWNSVSGTIGLTSYGTGSGTKELSMLVLTQTYVAGLPHRYNVTTSGALSYNATVNNNSPAASVGAVDIKGCGLYYTGVYVTNGSVVSRLAGPSVYTPPAPVVLNYVRIGETDQWQVTLTGDPNNNNTNYTAAQLTRSMRYKINDGSWVNVEAAEVKAIDATTIVTITVPAASTATIEGWMTYQGLNSEIGSITIANSDAPVHLYGSVNGQAQKLVHVYGSVNGRSVKLTKIYASVGGVAKLVHVDTGE